MEGFSAPQFSDLNDLRQEALRRLGQHPSDPPPFPEADGADPQRLLHELQVRQLELEMQNEELMAARQAQEAFHYRYVRYYDQAPVAYFNLNARGLIGRCNVAAARLLGYERRYLPGRGMLTLVCADDQAAFFTFFKHLAAGAPAGPCRVRLRGKNDLTGPVRLEGSCLQDEDGNPEYLVAAIALDAPEQTPAEPTAPERLLREAEAVGGTGSYEADLATMQFRFSDNLYRLLGQDPQSFVPTLDWIDSVSHPEDAVRVREVLDRAVAYREPYYYQRRIYKPGGEMRYLASHGKVVCDAEGRAVRLLGTVQDITGQVRSEQILDSLDEVCFELDGNFTIRYANRRALHAWGKPAGEVSGRKMWEVHPGYWNSAVSDALLKAFREGRQVHEEIWSPVDQQWMLLNANPTPAGLIVLHFDVTNRKRAEAALQESRDLLQSVFEATPNAISVFKAVRDEAGRIVDFEWLLAGPVLVRSFAGGRELVGKRYREVFAGEKAGAIMGRLAEVVETGRPADFEVQYQSQGDDTGCMRIIVVKLDDGVVATSEDVTAIRAAEAQLKENRALLHAVIEAAPVAIAVHGAVRDASGRITDFHYQFVNRETERQAGNRPLAGKRYRETFPGPQAAEWFAQFVRVVEENVPLRTEWHHTVDGADNWYLVSAVKLGDGLVVISQDVTDRKGMEAENLALKLVQQKALLNGILEAQEEERRRISESLHNGVGQLLYATKLNLDRVNPDLLPDRAAQLSEALDTTGRLLTEAIRETRRVSHELLPVLLHDFGLEKAIDNFCQRFTDTELRLTCRVVNLDDRLDPSLEVALYRISQELILNAVKHARADRVTLLLEKQAGELMLEVNDNGKGFGSGHAAAKGMGLRTIRDRVKLLNGTADFASSPGGVRATIRLPLP